MRVLVTGATGFIGTSLVRLLRERRHSVLALVRREQADIEGCDQIVWDIGNSDWPLGLPNDIDAIVHAAQSRNFRSFPGDCSEMFQVNVSSTAALLNFALDKGVRHFCLISSGSVYEPYAGVLDEEAALSPTSFLGASKLASEILAKPYGDRLSLSVLRLFFPYGPRQSDRLIPNILQRVRTGVPVQVAADGEGLRLTPTFVDDVSGIIETAVAEHWTGTFNVASPEQTTIARLAAMIGDIIGKPPIVEMTSQPAVSIVPSLTRLEGRFDLSSLTPLRKGLEAMIDG